METEQEPDRQDSLTERSVAAGSVGAFFKKIEWDIVSFFPNSPCVKKQKKRISHKNDNKKAV